MESRADTGCLVSFLSTEPPLCVTLSLRVIAHLVPMGHQVPVQARTVLATSFERSCRAVPECLCTVPECLWLLFENKRSC